MIWDKRGITDLGVASANEIDSYAAKAMTSVRKLSEGWSIPLVRKLSDKMKKMVSLEE